MPPTNTPVPTPQTSAAGQGFSLNAPPPDPGIDQAPDIQSNPTPPPVPVQTDPTPTPAPPAAQDPDAAQHGAIGRMFQAIAGGKKTVYDQTPQGPIPRQVDLKPGEIARTIIASAFSMLAAGGAGFLGKSIPASETIGGMRQEQDQQTQQQAQQQFQNKQAADREQREGQAAADDHTLKQAQLARYQQENYNDSINLQYRAKEEARAQATFNVDQSLKLANLRAEQGRLDQLDVENNVHAATIGGRPTPTFTGADQARVQAQMGNYIKNVGPGLFEKGFAVQARVVPNGDGTYTSKLIEVPTDRNFYAGYVMDGTSPKLDKDGKPIYDGSVRDPITGKPTGFQAPSYEGLKQVMTQQWQMAETKATIDERRAETAKAWTDLRKSNEADAALKDYSQNGILGMLPENKQILMQRITPVYSAAAGVLNKLLEEHGEKDKNGNYTDPETAAAAAEYMNIAKMVNELSTDTNAGAAYVIRLRHDRTEKGLPALNTGQLQQAVQQSQLSPADKAVAQMAITGQAGTLSLTPANIADYVQKNDPAVNQILFYNLASMGLQKATDLITQSPLPKANKEKMIARLQAQLGVKDSASAESTDKPFPYTVDNAVKGVTDAVVRGGQSIIDTAGMQQ